MKKCPFCAEDIQEEAIKCKHCGEMFSNIPDISAGLRICCPDGNCTGTIGGDNRCRTCGKPLNWRETDLPQNNQINSSTISAQKKCNSCGLIIFNNSKRCPHCNTKQNMSIFKIIFITIVVLFIIGLLLPGKENKNKNDSTNFQSVNGKKQNNNSIDKNLTSTDIKPDLSIKDFKKFCGESPNNQDFNKLCKGKSISIDGIIVKEQSDDEVEIDIGHGETWNVVLEKTSPRYENGSHVKFKATLDEQMGWGARMKNGILLAKLPPLVVKPFFPKEKRDEARHNVKKFIDEGLIQQIKPVEDNFVQLWIEPKFMKLPFEIKEGLCGWVVIGYCKDISGDIQIIDGLTGKEIGSYSANGLEIK